MELVDDVKVAHDDSPAQVEVIRQLAYRKQRSERVVLKHNFGPGWFFANSNKLSDDASLLQVDHRLEILVELEAFHASDHDSAAVQLSSVDLKDNLRKRFYRKDLFWKVINYEI